MKTFTQIALSVTVLAALSGCANNQDTGTFTGAAVGALIGSQFGSGTGQALAIGGGAIAGAMIGNEIGRRMDEVDRMRMQQTFENSRDGQVVAWTNPNTGVAYSVEPIRTYASHRGSPCREYRSKAIIGGKPQEIYGTACRQADGSWKVRG